MFIRRKILVPLSKEELEERIGKCSIPPFRRAKISENHFRAHLLLRRWQGRPLRIPSCLHGTYQIAENGCLVQYAAEPSISAFFLLALAICPLPYGLFSLFRGQPSQWFVLADVVFGFISILEILWEEQEGADRFEKRLKAERGEPPCPKDPDPLNKEKIE